MNMRSTFGAMSFVGLGLLSVHCSSPGPVDSGGAAASGSGSGSSSSGSSGNGGSSGTSSGSGGSSSSGASGGGSSSSGSVEVDGGSSSSGSSNGGSSSSGSDTAGSQSVLQRGGGIYRHGSYVESGLNMTAAAKMAPDTTFNMNATFPAAGNMQNQGEGSVLYLEKGPMAAGCPAGAMGCMAMARVANAGLFFAFPALGSNPNVVAFDETTGMTVWTAHVMTGGDGIRSTGVIDPKTRRLFVVTGSGPHLVHALSVDTGVEVAAGGWPVTLSAATVMSNGTAFNSAAQNQHGALLLLNNILYIPFGGQYGDGGNYRGWIIAVDTSNPMSVAGWVTQSARSGIWGAGGLVSDGTNVFGVTGDATAVARAASDSEEIVKITGMAQFTRGPTSVFVPPEWMAWDRPAGDLDFGASTPAFVPLPAGSNPPSLLVAPAKAGRLYVINATDLSAMALADLVVANTGAESVYTSPTIYNSASGLHATINVGVAPAGCPAGTAASPAMVISALIKPGQTPIATETWCAPVAGGAHMNYVPISTTTDGASANAIVWYVNGTQLAAVDGDTGKVVFTTAGAPCTGVPSMSFPIAVKNHIVVSALGHLCSWSPGGM